MGTGCKEIDDFVLKGGFEYGRLHAISGGSGTGKTLVGFVCRICSLSHCLCLSLFFSLSLCVSPILLNFGILCFMFCRLYNISCLLPCLSPAQWSSFSKCGLSICSIAFYISSPQYQNAYSNSRQRLLRPFLARLHLELSSLHAHILPPTHGIIQEVTLHETHIDLPTPPRNSSSQPHQPNHQGQRLPLLPSRRHRHYRHFLPS